MVAVCCLLCVVYARFAVWGVLFIVCCLRFVVVRGVRLVGRCVLCVVCLLPYDVCCSVCCVLCAVSLVVGCWLLIAVCCVLYVAWCAMRVDR